MRELRWPPNGSGPWHFPPSQARYSWAVHRTTGLSDNTHHVVTLWRHRPCHDEIDWPPEIAVRRGVEERV